MRRILSKTNYETRRARKMKKAVRYTFFESFLYNYISSLNDGNSE